MIILYCIHESNRVYSKRLSQRRKEKTEKDYCYPISLGLHLYASGMSKTSRRTGKIGM